MEVEGVIQTYKKPGTSPLIAHVSIVMCKHCDSGVHVVLSLPSPEPKVPARKPKPTSGSRLRLGSETDLTSSTPTPDQQEDAKSTTAPTFLGMCFR